MNNKDIGTTIANLRKSKKLTQNKLASLIYVSDKAISKWETGEGVPELSNLKELAKAFNVKVDYIINGLGKDGVKNIPQEYLLVPNSNTDSDVVITDERSNINNSDSNSNNSEIEDNGKVDIVKDDGNINKFKNDGKIKNNYDDNNTSKNDLQLIDKPPTTQPNSLIIEENKKVDEILNLLEISIKQDRNEIRKKETTQTGLIVSMSLSIIAIVGSLFFTFIVGILASLIATILYIINRNSVNKKHSIRTMSFWLLITSYIVVFIIAVIQIALLSYIGSFMNHTNFY